MTKKEMFAQVIRMARGEELAVTAEEVINFCNHEIELLSKKGGSSKPTAKQTENEGHKQDILCILAEADRPLTISQIMEDGRMEGLKNQRVTALMTQLKNAGLVIRSEEKKIAYFRIAE